MPLAAADPALAPAGSWWFEVGGGKALLYGSPGNADGAAANVGMGWTIAPQWALGVELGGAINTGDCAGVVCTEFGPDISHAALVVEYAVRHSSWRLRFGAGTFEYCTDAWFYSCELARGEGAGVYATYHLPLTSRAVWSMGVRVGAEVARLSVKPLAGAPSFWHSAAQLSVQLRRY